MPVSYRTRGPEAGNDPKTRNGTRTSVLLFRTRFLVEEAREVGGRGRGQCSHRHFMKIAPPVSSCPERSAEICYSHLAINSRYFISNTRSVARGMLRDDRFFLFPLPLPRCWPFPFFPRSRFVDDRLSRCLHHEPMKNSWKNIVINLEVIICVEIRCYNNFF